MGKLKLKLGAAALAAGAAVLALAGEAQTAVFVVGEGQAKVCERAAVAGESLRIYEKPCNQALEAEPLSLHDRAGTFVNRGVLRMRRAEWADARSDFDRAIRLMPEMGEAYVNRAAVAIGEGRYQEGLADIDRGLALGVDQPEKAYFNRALAHEGLSDFKAAYLDYRRAQQLKPDWALPQRELVRFTVTRR